MNLSRARLRYLSAIAMGGAVLPSMLAACKDSAKPPATEGDATATAIATGTTTPNAKTTATEPPARPPFNLPSCPSGAFCVGENAEKADAGPAAPAPYGKCAQSAVAPEDTVDSGYKPAYRSVSFSAANTATERAKNAKACCYTWVIPCPGGRAFRDATGTPSVARTIDRADWTTAVGALATAELGPADRASLAAHWTREAAFEHASIAAFAQLTLDLLSVGAPPELLEATQHATLDEIEHARITFALATAYGGRPVGPAALAALPGASRTLASIAKSTFVDACVGESVASASLAERSRKESDPVLRDLLAQMAEDEERHAELAWRIVAWALRTGGDEVAHALTDAQNDAIDELVSIAPGTNELRATVLREVVLPCTVALLSQTNPGPETNAGTSLGSKTALT